MVNVRECHLSIPNPELSIFCYEGLTGNENGPYNRAESIYCSAWNHDAHMCNLVLQPTVIINNNESIRHVCDCEKE